MSILHSKNIFLAGVPATGKTFFGNWLENNHNYLHLDIEKDESVLKHNLQNEASNFWNGNYDPLFYKLRDSNKPIVFNFGFGPENLHVIKHLLSYGLKAVWFEANNKIAREKFIERGDVSIEAYDMQIKKIENNKKELFKVFGKCIIKTLLDDGTRLSPEIIFKQMNQNLAK